MRSLRHFAISRIYNPQCFTIMASCLQIAHPKVRKIGRGPFDIAEETKVQQECHFFQGSQPVRLDAAKDCVHFDNTLCAGESFFTNCGWGSTWAIRSSIPALVPWTKSSRTTLARWAHQLVHLKSEEGLYYQRIPITAYNRPSQSPVNFYLPFLSRLNEILCHWAWSEVKTLGLSRHICKDCIISKAL